MYKKYRAIPPRKGTKKLENDLIKINGWFISHSSACQSLKYNNWVGKPTNTTTNRYGRQYTRQEDRYTATTEVREHLSLDLNFVNFSYTKMINCDFNKSEERINSRWALWGRQPCPQNNVHPLQVGISSML